jgi:hypothetical protein
MILIGQAAQAYFFFGFLTFKDGTHSLSRNLGNQLPIYAAFTSHKSEDIQITHQAFFLQLINNRILEGLTASALRFLSRKVESISFRNFSNYLPPYSP